MPLTVEGLHHAYGEGLPPVLRDVSMEVVPGQSVAIIGPSGSGKTTLLAILGLLLQPARGHVRLDGRLVRPRDAAALRRQYFGWVFQTANTIARRTVLDNAALGLLANGWSLGQAHERASECLSLVGLATMSERPAHTLSGGENQRLCIARAMAPAPRFLLADEPTGQLDRRTSDEVVAALTRARGPSTALVIVTHDPLVASACDTQREIRDGRMLPAGSGT